MYHERYDLKVKVSFIKTLYDVYFRENIQLGVHISLTRISARETASIIIYIRLEARQDYYVSTLIQDQNYNDTMVTIKQRKLNEKP